MQYADEEKYLDLDNKDFDSLYKLITTQYPSDQMKAYPVTRAVNSPRNNSKDLLKEIEIPKEKPWGYGTLQTDESF